MKKVTFLGPAGATFSHEAYNLLAATYNAPEVIPGKEDRYYIPASNNGEIVRTIIGHGGYGAIAMETLAEGRVAEPLESFIDLLKDFDNESCPLKIVGAIKLKLHFYLMARPGVAIELVSRIVAHPKALGACQERIKVMDLPTREIASNGEAARLVAQTEEYAMCAALGPRSAAEKYGLTVLAEEYEDTEAITTFFLITPRGHPIILGEDNRVLIVFRLPHQPGSLVKALLPFDEAGLNLIQIHSVHTGNHTYNFAIEVEVARKDLELLNDCLARLKKVTEKHIILGPFEVLSR